MELISVEHFELLLDKVDVFISMGSFFGAFFGVLLANIIFSSMKNKNKDGWYCLISYRNSI